MRTLVLWLLAVLAIPTAYLVFGLGRMVYAGPAPEAMARQTLYNRVRRQHGAAAMAAVAVGLLLVTAGRWSGYWVELIVGLAIGWPASLHWTRRRMRRGEVERGGPDESVPEDKLFPSDRLARLLYEGRAASLPVWLDLSILAVCEAAGVVVGLAVVTLVPAR